MHGQVTIYIKKNNTQIYTCTTPHNAEGATKPPPWLDTANRAATLRVGNANSTFSGGLEEQPLLPRSLL